AMQLLAGGVDSILSRASGKAAAKVLALDCDNTIWGGVVGEVGVAGLTLGQDGMGTVFTDFQKEATRLAGEGIVIVLLSKNNEPEVWEVFDQHSAMVLKRTHVTSWRINWDEKAANLKAIAEELDLNPDSFVFWDDNPLEREKMRMHLPQVITPEVPQDVSLWPRMLAGLDAFARFSVTDEDRKKTEQYRNRAAFVSEHKAAGDETSFLRSIELQPSALAIGATLLPRAAQMCAKTNQFNLRTIRHDESALVELTKKAGDAAFVVHLKDRFGDHGNTGLILGLPTADLEIAFLDTFLISCRVLGRHLEAWMLDTLAQRLRKKGVRWLLAEFIPTGRNVIAESFLANHGLRPLVELPPEQQKRLSTVAAGIANPTGVLFAADLQSLTIPYMDAFNYDQALAAKSA
ncbi:MAG TPA: HAD-IIIC family phosphatase, partial [Alphaproteobacteria bacterium]|nr:HAD-IIIC family phosphatase [Alphaproteobacteria bacterium]